MEQAAAPIKNGALENYFIPENHQFALSTQQIQENIPFIGSLFQKKGDFYRLKERYSTNAPGNIEEVEMTYGPGEYRLDIVHDEQTHSILFKVKGEEVNPIQLQSNTSLNELHQTELAEEKARYNRLKARFEEKDLELDQKGKKNRDLLDEIVETELRVKQRFENEVDTLKTELREAKEEKEKLDRKVWELKQELKYSDKKGGFDFAEMLTSALESPTLSTLAQNIMAKYQESVGEVAALPPRPNPDPEEQENQSLNDVEDMNQPQPQSPEVQLVQSVLNNIIQFGAGKLVEENPDLGSIQSFVNTQLTALKNQGYEFHPSNWVLAAKSLVQIAIDQQVPNDKVASVISPLLENLSPAKTALKYTPIKGVIALLKNEFKLSLEPVEEKVLSGVLEIFKKKLSE